MFMCTCVLFGGNTFDMKLMHVCMYVPSPDVEVINVYINVKYVFFGRDHN